MLRFAVVPFGTSHYIVTANPDGSVGLNAKEGPAVTAACVHQANLAAELLSAAEQLEAFVSVMFGAGPDCVIPEAVKGSLGIPIKVGEIMRATRAAIAKARSPL